MARSPLASSSTFGGATALAAVYLHHRRSEDLDFGEQLLKAGQIGAEDLPAMIKPLVLEDLQGFFEDAARRLIRRGP